MGWQRIFEDEFNQHDQVDTNKWEFDVGIGTGNDGWGNQEAQFYKDNGSENPHCENGHLVIEARREDFQGRQFTSARLKSKQVFQYGRLQVSFSLSKIRECAINCVLLQDPCESAKWQRNLVSIMHGKKKNV
jgi:hypothetical protein